MFDLHQRYPELTVWIPLFSVIAFFGTLLIVPVLVVAMPEDYFTRHTRREAPPRRHPVIRLTALVFKNLLGLVLVAGGIVMLVLPGQGLLTIMVGLVLMDFPGKYRLEKRLVSTGPVLRTMNWIRQRRGRPPLQVPD